MTSSSRPLRILIVVNLPWDTRLGAVRVFMGLMEQWNVLGHTVTVYSASEAFPARPRSAPVNAIRSLRFGRKAAAFVKKNASNFDVVDALIGSLHGDKGRLKFDGLVVARSVGLHLLYEKFDRSAHRRWTLPRSRLWPRVFYGLTNSLFRRAAAAALRAADVVNVPNEEEKSSVVEFGLSPEQVIVQPYGLDDQTRRALGGGAGSPELRVAKPRVSFLGMWSPRKGSKDWAEIVKLVWKQNPDVCFSFLGVMTDPANVMRDLGLTHSSRVQIVPEFSQGELPELLHGCTVGAFPSYVEGFGIAVIEQLAAGIPTVAFDVAGPHEMLAGLSSRLLVRPGDVPGFAAALLSLLGLDVAAYASLSEASVKRAQAFDWKQIAADTIDEYQKRLVKRGQMHPDA